MFCWQQGSQRRVQLSSTARAGQMDWCFLGLPCCKNIAPLVYALFMWLQAFTLGRLWSEALGFSTLYLFCLWPVCYLQDKFPSFISSAGRDFSISLTRCFLEGEKKKMHLWKLKKVCKIKWALEVNNLTSVISEKHMRTEQGFLPRYFNWQ